MSELSGDTPSSGVRQEVHGEGHAQIFVAGNDMHATFAAPPPPDAVVALRTLPRDIAAFTGRDSELLRIMRADTVSSGALTIHAIDGMPGVGKTALVTRTAHILADRYPDGQLFVDLHAHTPGRQPADPHGVLTTLLVGLGIAPKDVPGNLEACTSLWRDRLTGRRMLLVLDNAADVAQVEPLLPSHRANLVLITSRRRLLGLDGATLTSLGTLPPDQASDLFVRLTRRERTDANSDAISGAVAACGHLPLAISLLASRLAHHPDRELTAFVDEFTTALDRLDELQAGNRAVAAAFDLSYRALPADRQRFFRRLGMHAGVHIDPFAAAALGNISVAQARRMLDFLHSEHLVEEISTYRYRFHDLIRAFAQTLSSGDPPLEQDRTIARMKSYYQQAAESADRYLTDVERPGPSCPSTFAVPDVRSHEQALEWMRTERVNLLACIETEPQNASRHTIGLTAALASHLRQEGPWPEAAALHRAAAESARDFGTPLEQANALFDLGRIESAMGDYATAEETLRLALDLYRTLENPLGQANALNMLGNAQQITGRGSEAVELQQKALALHEQLENRLGQAISLFGLGRIKQATGDYSGAAELHLRALSLYRQTGNLIGQANALNMLGQARYATGGYSLSVDLHQEALLLYTSIGNRLGQAHALHDIGRAEQVVGDDAAALASHRQALVLYEAVGNRLGQANTSHDLGRLAETTGNRVAASAFLQRALTLYESVGDRLGQANTLHAVGRLEQAAGKPGAADLYRRAWELFRASGDPDGEAQVVYSMGTLRAETDPTEALGTFRRARRLARQVGNPFTEAEAIEGTARCQAHLGDRRSALITIRQALKIYRTIGVAEAESADAFRAELEAEFSEPEAP
ncbi:ATP-binding protein [Streptomyces sp. NPDC021019]|uniref:ATP-binding protein n=1 Tax=Streptomyces sp. NPDC021019 TaxID=3365108 RepID=UPI0037B99F67